MGTVYFFSLNIARFKQVSWSGYYEGKRRRRRKRRNCKRKVRGKGIIPQ